MNKFRARSAKNVVDEIEFVVKEFGIKEILFYDDTFTLNQKRVMEICREINRRGLNIEWDCRTRVDCVSRELLFEMKKAGCTRIHYGVNLRFLPILRKRFNSNFSTRASKEKESIRC